MTSNPVRARERAEITIRLEETVYNGSPTVNVLHMCDTMGGEIKLAHDVALCPYCDMEVGAKIAELMAQREIERGDGEMTEKSTKTGNEINWRGISKSARANLEPIIAKFQSGDLSDLRAVAMLSLPEDAPARRWSFGNRLFVYAQTGTLDCRTYKQWQEAGRQVIAKGASHIFGPRYTKSADKQTGEEIWLHRGYRSIPVFEIAKTEGDEIADYQPTELPPLADLAERLGIDVKYHPLPEDRRADCSTDGSEINLGTTDPHSWFHELGHALEAKLNGKLAGGQQVDQETVAEMVACALMWIYDFGDDTGNSWRYISHYSDDPLRAIQRALATVGQIVDYITEAETEVEAE